MYEAHHTLGGRARTAEAPYRTNDGPHALYNGGPHWAWLRQRDLDRPARPAPAPGGRPAAAPPPGRPAPHPALRHAQAAAPQRPTGPRRRGLHDVGDRAGRRGGRPRRRALLRRRALPPRPRRPVRRVRTGAAAPRHQAAARGALPARRLGEVIDRMAARAWNLGVRMETLSRVDTLPTDAPVVVATSLDAARRLLGDDSLTWTERPYRARRPRRAHPARRRLRRLRPGRARLARTVHRPGPRPRPRGRTARPGADPDRPARDARPTASPAPSSCSTWASRAGASASPGGARPSRTAVPAPSTCPAPAGGTGPPIDRGDGVYLAGDQVAAPGVLSEVSFNSALTAGLPRPSAGTRLDLKHA